jgi:hypothetical protein
MTQLGTGTAVEQDLARDPRLDDGDDDPKYSHFVRKDDILRSAVDGVPVTALCGKKWLPSRDPEKYPVCPRCQEMMGVVRAMDDSAS